jgi:DNA modification methylase
VERTEKLKLIDIDKLIPYVNNARTHNKEQITKLRSSLREFGFVSPVLIDKDFNILAGHGRIIAAKEEGLKDVPCVLVEHLTEAQKKAYILADNKLALEAELKEPTISKQGDIWLLGRHRLICGDSTKAETYEMLMEGKKANLVVTDLPYNVNYEGTAGKIQNDNMSDKDFFEFLLKSFKNMYNSMADGAAIYVFHADRETVNFRTSFKEAGFFCHQTCIWVKNAPVLGRSDYLYSHEPIMYGWKPTTGHKFYADRKQKTVWYFDKPTKSPLHPTSKPVGLIAYPITNSSLTNSIVLEPFSGSASTLIACEETDRICYAIEIEEKFVDVGVKRYVEKVSSDKEVFLLRNGQKIAYKNLIKSE